MNTPDWDAYFMTMVYLVASRSPDNGVHIGAIIVGPHNEIRSTGYNGFIRGLNDNVPERQEKPEKFFWFEHAERNAIYNAARVGIPLEGCRMYTNGIPCADCARGVSQSGLIEVIVDKEWDDTNTEIWKEHAKRSLQMFREAAPGVSVRYYTGPFIEVSKFFKHQAFPLRTQ